MAITSGKGSVMRGFRGVVTVFMVIACAVVGAGGAAARPLVHEHYRGTDEFSFDDCGFPIDAVGTFSGLFILKDGRGGDPTPYVLNNYDASTVYTNSDTGAWFTISGNGLYKDMRLTQVAGTVYRLDAMEVGRPFRVQDSDGIQVMVDRGRLLYTALLDTQGDADLSNDVFFDGTFEVLADNGAHPGFYTDFCDLATGLIG